MGNKYDLGCIITGVITSSFFGNLAEKTITAVISMLIATTVAFFWRRYLHKKSKEALIKSKLKEREKIKQDGTVD